MERIVLAKLTANALQHNQEYKGAYRKVKRTIEKQKRCTVIDAHLLERELGIPVDTWIR